MGGLANTEVDLAGDGQCDSPGYAKFRTYAVLDTEVNNIVHFKQITVGKVREAMHVLHLHIYFGASKKNTPTANGKCIYTNVMQSSAVPNSVSMEKGLVRWLEEPECQGGLVQSLTTGKILI